MDTHRFDVAVSFAGSDRAFVESIVLDLKAKGVSVFYDSDFQPEIWGQNLIEYFERVYMKDARFAIMFVSRAYAERMWTTHERRTILLRALSQTTPYALPVRLDETELPGLSAAVGYLDARRTGSNGIIEAVLGKLELAADSPAASIIRTPRNRLELGELLAARPRGWEYLQLSAELNLALERSEPVYQDYQMGYYPLGEAVPDDRVLHKLSDAANESGSMMTRFNAVMSQRAQEGAVGAPGEDGDPRKIEHLAHRWNEGYLELMSWTGRLRGWRVSETFRPLVLALSEYTRMSIESYRQFVTNLVRASDAIPDAVAHDRPVTIRMTLDFVVDPAVAAHYDREFELVRRRLLP